MGRIAVILSFSRVEQNGVKTSDVKIDTGGGYNITAQHYASPGDDSFPLKTDFVAIDSIPRRGGAISLGYLDPLNTPKAQEGDKRIYSRNAGSGVPVAEVWLKNDGSVLTANDNGSVLLRPDGGTVTTTPNSTFDAAADGSIQGVNGNGSFELQAGGDFIVNGVTIKANGDVIMPNSLLLNGKEIDDHDHNITGGSSAPGPTGGNN